MLRDLAEVIVEALHGAAVEAGPEGRFRDGGAAGGGHGKESSASYDRFQETDPEWLRKANSYEFTMILSTQASRPQPVRRTGCKIIGTLPQNAVN
jgi:hypothetical protein